ncbi:MAG: ABC transporter ATP-binding protein [Gemmatimonadales bacterium]
MIKASGLTKQFGKSGVLDQLDFSIRRGERVAILGLNGAGKTTLIRCLLGLTGFEGKLEIAGYDVCDEGRDVRACTGYVPQRAPHFDGSLAEVVEFFSQLRDIDTVLARQRLEEFGLPLEVHGEKAIRELSGGMLQKALLALALGAQVPLLLLDEPTANLDARTRSEFVRSLRGVEDDVTILLATHRLADVEAVAERLLVLHGGHFVFDGRMADLWDRVDAEVTLWIKVSPKLRDTAGQLLKQRWSAPAVRANGAALGIQVDRGIRAAVLVELQNSGIPVDDFWTESPSLSELMERLLSRPVKSGVARSQADV